MAIGVLPPLGSLPTLPYYTLQNVTLALAVAPAPPLFCGGLRKRLRRKHCRVVARALAAQLL